MSAAELIALEAHYAFDRRHIGPSEAEIAEMLKAVGARSLEELAARTVPAAILEADLSTLPPAVSEAEAIADLLEAEDCAQDEAEARTALKAAP